MNLHPFERMKQAAEAAESDLDAYYPKHIPEHRCMGHRVAHKPTLNLEDYIIPGAVSLPPFVHRRATSGLGMLLNDQLGDCGPAMAIHGTEMFHRDAGTPVPPFHDRDAEGFYSLVGGYVPGQPSTDQGVDNNVLVEKWKSPGLKCSADNSNHTIVASLFVDPSKEQLTKLAIWEFVVNFRAYGLPATAQQQAAWEVVGDGQTGDSALGSWGYHDVPLTSYGPWRVGLITWGQPWTATWAFDRAYAVQSFVVVTREQLNLQGISPAGVDWSALNADLAKLPSVSSGS